jgi:hypothetical protein
LLFAFCFLFLFWAFGPGPGCARRPIANCCQLPIECDLRGAPKGKKNESDVYLADDKSGTMVPFFFLIFEIFFMAFLCVSQQGEFKNTIKNFLGKSMSKTFGRKS